MSSLHAINGMASPQGEKKTYRCFKWVPGDSSHDINVGDFSLGLANSKISSFPSISPENKNE